MPHTNTWCGLHGTKHGVHEHKAINIKGVLFILPIAP